MKHDEASSEKVDVVVLTKNSERVLERCLNSIYKNLPVNRLIIVDGYSTDSTLEIIERFRERYGNVILLMDNGTRGSARMKGIRDVNKIVEYCAEKSSIYGFALYRYFLDKLEDYRRKGYTLEEIVRKGIWDRDYDKAYYFKPSCDLIKLRELIAKGTPTEEALRKAKCK